MFFEGLGQFSHHVIHLVNEVPMGARVRFAFEFLAWKGGQMNGLHGMKEEEGLVRFFLLVSVEERKTLLEKDLVDRLEVEIRGDHARPVVPGIRMFGQRTAVHDLGGRNGNAIPINVGIEPIRGRTACGTKEMIESAVHGSAPQRPCIIDSFHRLQSILMYRRSIFIIGSYADVPLSEHRRLVALLAEHAGQGSGDPG